MDQNLGYWFLSFILMTLAGFLILFHTSAKILDRNAAAMTTPGDNIYKNSPAARKNWVLGRIAKAENQLIRVIDPTSGDMGGRHKFRWLYKNFEATFYKSVLNTLGAKAAVYVWALHYGVWIAIGFLFSGLASREINPKLNSGAIPIIAASYFAAIAYPTFSGIEEDFSYIELATVAGGLYFALRGKLLAFLAILFVATANRETGVVLGVVYSLIQGPRHSGWWLPPIAGVIFLFGTNFDLLIQPSLYDSRNFLATYVPWPTLFTFLKWPLSMTIGFLLELCILFSPLLFIVRQAIGDILSVKILCLFSIYTLVLLLGTYIGNIFPYMVLIPFLVVLSVRAIWLRNADRPSP